MDGDEQPWAGGREKGMRGNESAGVVDVVDVVEEEEKKGGEEEKGKVRKRRGSADRDPEMTTKNGNLRGAAPGEKQLSNQTSNLKFLFQNCQKLRNNRHFL
jgi:hypothetical protein